MHSRQAACRLQVKAHFAPANNDDNPSLQVGLAARRSQELTALLEALRWSKG
jgi:hypothetical protein